MGYYTYFNGKIDYSNLPVLNQEIIEKIYDAIELMQWGCSSSHGFNGQDVYFYDKKNEWIHYYHGVIDKENKSITFSNDYKNYYDSVQTTLYFIAPYLNKETTYLVEFNGEDEYDYDNDGNEVGPEPNRIIIRKGIVYENNDVFETDNKFSFPFPAIKPSRKY